MNYNSIIYWLQSNTKLHAWATVVVIVLGIFPIESPSIGLSFKVIVSTLYAILIVWGIFNLFVIIQVRKDSEGRLHYLTRIITVDELIEGSNFDEYAKLFFLLLFSQFVVDLLGIPGLILYLSIVALLVVSSLLVLYRDFKRNQGWTTVVIGNLFLLICLLMWSKWTYSRTNGAEKIGSFFEKPEYHTKYYVNLFPETSKSKNYRLVADIHVYSESEEDYDGNSHYNKAISIEKIYFNNGGYLYFDDCRVKPGEKTYCIDQRDRGWYIELTNTKVE